MRLDRLKDSRPSTKEPCFRFYTIKLTFQRFNAFNVSMKTISVYLTFALCFCDIMFSHFVVYHSLALNYKPNTNHSVTTFMKLHSTYTKTYFMSNLSLLYIYGQFDMKAFQS